jgi:hypothetical protein
MAFIAIPFKWIHKPKGKAKKKKKGWFKKG